MATLDSGDDDDKHRQGLAGRAPGRIAWEMIIVSALLIIATLGIDHLLALRYFTSSSDSAGMVDLVKNVAAGHGLVNSAFDSINDLWALQFADATAYCNLDFIPKFRGASVLIWHAYFIAYPIGWLTFIPGITAAKAVMALTAISHVGVLGLVWWFLRRQGAPMIVTAMFCVAIFVFKPWSESLLGQLYFDRLFILPGTALILMVHLRLTEKMGSLVLIAGLAFVSALISERPALMVGVFLIGYPILRQGFGIVKSRDGLVFIALGVVCLVYVALYTKIVQNSPYLSSWTDLGSVRYFLGSAVVPGGALYHQTLKLYAVTAPLLVLSLFDWRLALIAAGAVVPNLMVSVGGAEKNLFVTHYHMPYVPFLLSSSTVGVGKIWLLVRGRRSADSNAPPLTRRSFSAIPLLPVTALTLWLALSAAYNNWLNPADLSRTFIFNDPIDPVITRVLVPGLANPRLQPARDMRAFYHQLASNLPKGASVSAWDSLWPALVDHGDLKIDFMPYGIGMDSYVMLTYALTPEGGYSLQTPVYRPDADLAKIRACVQARVDRSYRLLRQTDYAGTKFAIYAHR